MDTALQYGAMGLLALVLSGLAIGLREYMRRAEASRGQADEFIRQLAERAMASQDEHIAAWREMPRQSLEAQSQTAEALARLLVLMEEHERRASQRQGKRQMRRRDFSS